MGGRGTVPGLIRLFKSLMKETTMKNRTIGSVLLCSSRIDIFSQYQYLIPHSGCTQAAGDTIALKIPLRMPYLIKFVANQSKCLKN